MSWDAARERALCQAASRGDREALRELCTYFAEPLFAGVILPRIGNRADAEDVLRETLLRAVHGFERFEYGAAGVWPWLRRIAMNLVIDRARKARVREQHEQAYEAELRTLPPSTTPGAEADLIAAQERLLAERQLRGALARLNERYRRAIELRVLDERPRLEVAALLGVTPPTFDVLLHRALAALRKSWETT